MAIISITLARGADPSARQVGTTTGVNVGELAIGFEDTTPHDEIITSIERMQLALQEYLSSVS